MTYKAPHELCTLTFYTVEACSLCEQALEWLELLGVKQQFSIEIIDIVTAENSSELVSTYGAIVPVIELYSVEGSTQIHAPFSLLDLQQFLT